MVAAPSATAWLVAIFGISEVKRALAGPFDANFSTSGTNFTLTFPDGLAETLDAAPARWNAWHPKSCPAGSRWRCLCPQPVGALIAAVNGALIPAPGEGYAGLGHACGTGQVPPPPMRGTSLLVTRRGDCSFREKVSAAQELGYCGLIVANEEDGAPHPFYGRLELPDMSAEPDGSDAEIGIPAWIVSKSTGDVIFDRLQTGTVLADVRDFERKPAIGQAQEDIFGVRDHQVS